MMIFNRHAYLIMAHSNFGLLEKLLRQIDDPRNDIYIHIDKKVKYFDFDHFKKVCTYSKVNFTNKRINVKWGHSSQVKTEMCLYEMAVQGRYAYYHLLSGVDLCLKTQDEIHCFFENKDREYIYYKEQPSIWDYQRLSWCHFPKNWDFRIIAKLNRLQEKLKVDRIKKYGMAFQKGYNWCSLTHDAVVYLVSHKNFIFKICCATVCADECYKQYLLCNSPFAEKIFKNSEGRTDDLREIDWERRVKDSPHVYTIEDLPRLKASQKLFARKFDEKIDSQVIDAVIQYVESRKTQE